MNSEKLKTDTKFIDQDDLDLCYSFIEALRITFNPKRTINFEMIKPHDKTELKLRYNKGVLTFHNVVYGNLEIINEKYEYPEFYGSAIVYNSDLLTKTLNFLGVRKNTLKHYFLYIDNGNSLEGYQMICENHELKVENEPKYLEEFEGFEE